jgi:hypothetical protein
MKKEAKRRFFPERLNPQRCGDIETRRLGTLKTAVRGTCVSQAVRSTTDSNYDIKFVYCPSVPANHVCSSYIRHRQCWALHDRCIACNCICHYIRNHAPSSNERVIETGSTDIARVSCTRQSYRSCRVPTRPLFFHTGLPSFDMAECSPDNSYTSIICVNRGQTFIQFNSIHFNSTTTQSCHYCRTARQVTAKKAVWPYMQTTCLACAVTTPWTHVCGNQCRLRQLPVASRQRKTDKTGRSHDLPGAYWLLASSMEK